MQTSFYHKFGCSGTVPWTPTARDFLEQPNTYPKLLQHTCWGHQAGKYSMSYSSTPTADTWHMLTVRTSTHMPLLHGNSKQTAISRLDIFSNNKCFPLVSLMSIQSRSTSHSCHFGHIERWHVLPPWNGLAQVVGRQQSSSRHGLWAGQNTTRCHFQESALPLPPALDFWNAYMCSILLGAPCNVNDWTAEGLITVGQAANHDCGKSRRGHDPDVMQKGLYFASTLNCWDCFLVKGIVGM